MTRRCQCGGVYGAFHCIVEAGELFYIYMCERCERTVTHHVHKGASADRYYVEWRNASGETQRHHVIKYKQAAKLAESLAAAGMTYVAFGSLVREKLNKRPRKNASKRPVHSPGSRTAARRMRQWLLEHDLLETLPEEGAPHGEEKR